MMEFDVEVAYAGKEGQAIIPLRVNEKATVIQAIKLSGILAQFPEILNDRLHTLEGRVGIFGKIVTLEAELKPSDRVEIYRVLLHDPKEARRVRAAKDAKRKLQAREAAESIRFIRT